MTPSELPLLSGRPALHVMPGQKPKAAPTGKKTVTLYPDQEKVKREIYDRIKEGQRRIILIAKTGFGKTRVAASIIHDAHMKGKRSRKCVFLVDKTCLIDQSAEAFDDLGIPYSILQGKNSIDWSKGVVIASMQTIEAKLRKCLIHEVLGEVDLFIADECHDTAYRNCYRTIEQHYYLRGAIMLGVTGTPWRLKKTEYLAQWYDAAVEAPQPPELIKMGRSVIGRIFAVSGVFDLDKVKMVAGDYSESQLETQALRKEAIEVVVQKWIEKGENRPTVSFSPTVDHAKKLCEAFNAAGVAAEVQDGSTPDGVRREQKTRLRNGTTFILCTCGTAVKGWDCKEVSCILFCTSTKSKAKFFQGAGRADRTCPGKNDYILFDFGDNVRGNSHGSPSDYQDYSIAEKPKKPEGEAPYKECPQCGFLNLSFNKFCTECNYQFVLNEELPLDDDPSTFKLIEYFDKATRAKATFIRKARKAAYREDQSPSIADALFKQEFGHIAPDDWVLHACLGANPSDGAKLKFNEYLLRHQPTPQHTIWRLAYWRQEFGEQMPKKLR